MHSNLRRPAGLGRWLVSGAAVLAVALPVAASVSASAPPSEPPGSSAPAGSDSAPAGGDSAPTGSEAAGSACANVFPADAAPTGDTTMASPAPADTSVSDTSMTDASVAPPGDTATADTGAADVAAAPDTAATAETGGDVAVASVPADTGAAGDTTAGSVAVPAGPFVQTAETALGTILVDAECRALYAFTADVDGESTCFDGCAAAWPPLLVPGDAVPELAPDLDPALFSVVEHPEGPMLKVGDFPLYYFASDVAPGDLNGQGVNGVWFVVAPDGTLIEDAAGAAAGGGSAPTDSAATATAVTPADSAPTGSEPKGTDSEY